MTRRSEHGAALIYAALLVVAFSALGLAHVARARALALSHGRDRADAHLDAALSGGVEHARWALARDADYVGDALVIGPCDVTISVAPGGVHVTATTNAAPFAETVSRHVDVELEPRPDRLPHLVTWTESH